MRIDMWSFEMLKDWLKVKTEEEVVAWLHKHHVKIADSELYGYVNAIEFELAYDKLAIEGFIKKYDKNWVKHYLPRMKTLNTNFKNTNEVKVNCEIIRNLFEGKDVSTDQLYAIRAVKKVTGFPFRGASKEETLTILFEKMKGYAIAPDTNINKFKKLFLPEEITCALQIVWLLTAGDLAYFFEKLIEIGFLPSTTQYNARVRDHKFFVDESKVPFSNLKVAKQTYLMNKNTKPKNYLFFDSLFEKFKIS